LCRCRRWNIRLVTPEVNVKLEGYVVSNPLKEDTFGVFATERPMSPS